jgi:transposase-like protein
MSKTSSRNERGHFGQEFRLSAVALVEEQGYTNAQALVIHENLLRTWRNKYGKKLEGSLRESAQEGLGRLRKENLRLRMERGILKKRRPFSRTKRTEVSVL